MFGHEFTVRALLAISYCFLGQAGILPNKAARIGSRGLYLAAS
jgi:hypothetical protein